MSGGESGGEMLWKPMTMDEFAAFQQADGMKVVKVDDAWWAEIRPFFFRPLLPLTVIDPMCQSYPVKARLGGVLHAALPGSPANSQMHFFVYDDLDNYSLETLSKKRRKLAVQGMDTFVLKEFSDLDAFVTAAYPVYLCFFRRTKYRYRSDRVEKEGFVKWATVLFEHPKIVKVGAFHGDQLCAVEISYQVEDVIIGDTLFSNEFGKRQNVTDFVLHRLREAAVGSGARYFYLGLPTGVASLDQSKLIRGCKVLTRPAYLRINPVALSLAKLLMKPSYRKLQEIITPQLPQLMYGRPDTISHG
jgi:hypothetical protein